MKYNKLIITIVNHRLGEKLALITREAGALGGTILVGKGRINSTLLQFFALADIEKDVLLTLVTDNQFDNVFSAIKTAPCLYKDCGDSYVIELGGSSMTENKYNLITLIVNRGYADDVMSAARKAGARGGTILHARGTGKPDDEKFFGITIVPEKEQILIISEKDETKKITDAIESLPFLKTPGTGILFVLPVTQYFSLGGKKK